MSTFNFHKIVQYGKKLHYKQLLALLFISLGIYFFRKQREELSTILPALRTADPGWVGAGLAITVLYILMQSGMYVFSFAALRSRLPWLMAIELYVKRNFLSVFLPAGGVTALAYMPMRLRKSDIHKKEIHQASGLYAFAGMLTLFLVGLPVVVYTVIQSGSGGNAIIGIISIAAFILLIIAAFISLRSKGLLHRLLARYFPSAALQVDELVSFRINSSHYIKAIICSVFVELSGVVHLLVAMLAIGVQPSIEAACIGYVISVVLLAGSPFLRGLGAVEISIAYILTLYHYTPAQALEITILYRIFEFWLPLASGMFAFALKGKNLFLRIAPAVLIFILGLINILSAITPPVRRRLFLLRQYIPADLIQASNLLVILMGLLLIITAGLMLRGLRNAWVIALVISIFSLVLNLSKALDYEEAILAAVVIVILLATYKQYRLKSNPALVNIGVITAVGLFLAVVIFQVTGFYFLDKKHFGFEFNFNQSIAYATRSFLLLSSDREPLTRFGTEFIIFIRVLSAATWIFFFFTFIRPWVSRKPQSLEEREEARSLLTQYGSSAVDYFKVDDDKRLFFSEDREGFIAYRIAGGFAIALEDPVAAEKDKIIVLKEFEQYCRKAGLRAAFYRVDEDSLYYFDRLKKSKLLVGQEAVMEISTFTLEGKDKKSLRNGLNSLAKKGFTTQLCEAPLDDRLIKQLKKVSDEWLEAFEKKEAVFSQGMFNEDQLKQEDVIILKSQDNEVVAFLNIIPDYTPNGLTYDMIRKNGQAPGGCMDALVIALINYGKERHLQWLNLGLVPLSGITVPENTAERMVKFAYEKINRFQHYRGLREFKEKYATQWLNKYLVYDNDYDLMQLPVALNKVMIPEKEKV